MKGRRAESEKEGTARRFKKYFGASRRRNERRRQRLLILAAVPLALASIGAALFFRFPLALELGENLGRDVV